MRKISGAWRRDGTFELVVGDRCSRTEAAGVQLVVSAGTSDAPSADMLLQRYDPADPHALRTYARDAAFVLFDPGIELLLISRDTFGTTPLYYVADTGGTAFATTVRDLSTTLTPNRRALAALLVDFGAPQPDETYFANVRALPPGSMLMQRGGTLSVVPPPALLPATENRSFEQSVAEFDELFQAAVQRRVDANSVTGVLVSGGLDSAAVICTAARYGDVVGITYGLADGGPADESRYIEMLRSAGHRIERIPFYPTLDADAIAQSVVESEAPAVDYVTLTQQRAAIAARSSGATSLLMGTLGDQVLSPFPPPHLGRIAPWRRCALRAAADALQRHMTDVPVADIEHALFRQSVRRRLPRSVRALRSRQTRRRAIFDRLAEEFPPPRVSQTPTTFGAAVLHSVTTPFALDAIAGTTKWGFSNDVDARLPFLDVDLVRFLASVSDDHAYRNLSLKPLLREAMKGLVPDELLARRDKGDYTAAISAGLPARALLIEQLNGLDECVDFGLMTRRSAVKTMARLRKDAEIGTTQRLLMQLASVSVFLRVFFASARSVK